MVNAYHVASAATMITFAAVGAVFSYRRVYCIGLAIFTLTSIGCAVANDLWTLVAFRSLQGFSYAAMVSIGIGMYRKIYPPELLGSILGINALIVALGTVAGPTLGGIIVSTLGWPWLFLINVPFGVAALYLGLRNLPADEGSGARLDLSSIGYSVLAIGFVVIAIDQAGRWDNGIVWTLLACGAVLATVFLRRQRRLDAPLLPLDIFASKRFPSPPRPRWPRSRRRAFPSWPCRSCSSPSMDTAPSSRPCCSRPGRWWSPWPRRCRGGCPTRSTRPCCLPSASASSRWGCS